MRRKLLLIVALGAFVAMVIAGSAHSLTLLGENAGGSVLPQCSDLSDNDRDGRVDLNDGGCSGPLDNSEDGGGGGVGGILPGGGGGGGGGSGGGGGGGGGGGSAGGGGGKDHGTGGVRHRHRKKQRKPATRRSDGVPTRSNPTLSVADFGPARIGVPNFMIDQFQIPPFLLPIYQACGTQYGIPWEVLAAINRIETAFGTNLNVSSAGAVGWMQFLPSTWKAYGVDANDDGKKDPYNPVDAICAASRYLKAAGGDKDLRRGIFAYNHADWYVDEVLLYAKSYGKLPEDLIGSLTGLTEGAHFPVAAKARYADDLSEREALKKAKPGSSENVANVVRSSPTRRGINIYSRVGAPVVAVNDGVIKEIGENKKLGKYIILQDAFGNRYTYAQLGRVVDAYPAPKERTQLTDDDFKLIRPKKDDAPDAPATAGSNRSRPESEPRSRASALDTEELRERLFALPQRPHNIDRAKLSGQLDALLGGHVPGYETFKNYFADAFKFDRRTTDLKPLREGSRLVGGTILGWIAKTDKLAPHVHFAIRPAGRGAPKIDPKPILDGWKLTEATALYRIAGKNALTGSATVGQILLMSKQVLERRVLADPRLQIYSCGRQDVRTGQIDRRILASLEYLAARGFRLTVTSLKCGHSYLTASGNVSEHSSGNAVDIAAVNGIPILGHQGKGSITAAVIEELLRLQGNMEPHQIISLMDLGPPTFSLSDHADHIHLGFRPLYGSGKLGKQFARLLGPDQWERLIARIAEIDNPHVRAKPSKYATPARKQRRASRAHRGE
jgi:hypothetical protein